MQKVRTPSANMVFKHPNRSDGDLPVEVASDENGAPVLISTWKLNADEIAALRDNEHCFIELMIWGEQHPPVSLAVATIEEVEISNNGKAE